jgi:hypothetical protein
VLVSAQLPEMLGLQRNFLELAENYTFLDRQLIRATDGTGDNREFTRKD